MVDLVILVLGSRVGALTLSIICKEMLQICVDYSLECVLSFLL